MCGIICIFNKINIDLLQHIKNRGQESYGFSYFNIAPSLLVLLLIAFGLFLARQFFTYTRLIYDTIISQRLIQLQRNRIFDGYIDANTSYHDRTPVGSVMNIILTEVNGAIVSIMLPMSMLVYVIMFSGYFSVLILLSWEMTIFSIVAFLIASMIPKSWINKKVILYALRGIVVDKVSRNKNLVGEGSYLNTNISIVRNVIWIICSRTSYCIAVRITCYPNSICL